jgi:hypothetical protein
VSEICNPTLRAVCINWNQSGDHLRPERKIHSTCTRRCVHTCDRTQRACVRTNVCMYIRLGAEEGFTLHSCRSEMLMVKRVMKGESCCRDPDDQSAAASSRQQTVSRVFPTLADLHQPIKVIATPKPYQFK